MITIFNGKITKLGLYALISSILLGSSSGITFYKTGENEKQKLQNILNQTTNNPVQKQTKIKLSENVSITPQQNVSSVTIANSEYDLETFENAGSSSINHNEKPKNTNNSNTTLTRSKHIKLVEYIKSQLGDFEKHLELLNQQIEKLKEYKTTLINDAVTGKIKVA